MSCSADGAEARRPGWLRGQGNGLILIFFLIQCIHEGMGMPVVDLGLGPIAFHFGIDP
jgi:hypothetical protein